MDLLNTNIVIQINCEKKVRPRRLNILFVNSENVHCSKKLSCQHANEIVQNHGISVKHNRMLNR